MNHKSCITKVEQNIKLTIKAKQNNLLWRWVICFELLILFFVKCCRGICKGNIVYCGDMSAWSRVVKNM